MSAPQWLGVALIALVFGVITWLMVADGGWRPALFAWTFTAVVFGVLGVAAALVTGELA